MNTITTKEAARAAARDAVKALGGLASAARRLNVPGHRYQTVQSWLSTQVPAEYCPKFERETQGRTRCEQLRPDIDWAVLRVHPTSSTAPASTQPPAPAEDVQSAQEQVA